MSFEEYMKDKVDIVHNRSELYRIYQSIVDDLNATGKLKYDERQTFYSYVDAKLNHTFQELIYTDDEGNSLKISWMLGYVDEDVKEGEFSLVELFSDPHVEFQDWSSSKFLLCKNVLDGFEKMYESYLEYNGIVV